MLKKQIGEEIEAWDAAMARCSLEVFDGVNVCEQAFSKKGFAMTLFVAERSFRRWKPPSGWSPVM
jgi:hypothetical protein